VKCQSSHSDAYQRDRSIREEAHQLSASGGVEAEGEGERVVAAGARVPPGAGRGEGEEVLEEVVLGAAGRMLARHGRRRSVRGVPGSGMKVRWLATRGCCPSGSVALQEGKAAFGFLLLIFGRCRVKTG
jgi:hypothetical protein